MVGKQRYEEAVWWWRIVSVVTPGTGLHNCTAVLWVMQNWQIVWPSRNILAVTEKLKKGELLAVHFEKNL